jgi:ubiquinol-cytochrome c reductase cytochrome b subunit
LIFLMPFIGGWNLGHRFNVLFLACLIAGAGLLTYLAFAQDLSDPHYLQAVENTRRDADRVKNLASSPAGIPVTGALSLLRQDPLTQGPRLFARHCASCHRYDGHDALGILPSDPPSAPDLKGFASRDWLAGFLDPDQITSPDYFGGTEFADGKMVRYVRRHLSDLSPEQRENLDKVIAALSAEAQLPAQTDLDARDAVRIAEGKELLVDEFGCVDCHQFHLPDDAATAPDLTAYGSREWLIDFIVNPAHHRFYGDNNDRMPAFGNEEILSPLEIGLLADWLRGEWYEPPQPLNSAIISPGLSE